MDDTKPLVCKWCKKAPYVRHTGEVECETPYCKGHGFACDSVYWWNAAMRENEKPIFDVEPCYSCGRYPYRYGEDAWACKWCNSPRMTKKEWNDGNCGSKPMDVGAVKCSLCGQPPVFYAIYDTNYPLRIRCNNLRCDFRTERYIEIDRWNIINNAISIGMRQRENDNGETVIKMESDSVVHPSHYNWFGIECMDVVKHFGFVLGNVIKYAWRAGYKSSSTKLEDLQKAMYYLNIEIEDEKSKLDAR